MPFKENLMSALHEAVNLRNHGADDNDAVAKVASDHRFNQEQTRRLVETYNTAKTIHFYKAAEDRSGEFPLADPNVVLGNMTDFDRSPQKSATASVGLYDYTDYDRPETEWRSGEEKAAEALFTEEPDAYADADINLVTASLIKKASEIRRTAEHCRSTAGHCTEKYAQALDRLTTFVQHSHGAGHPEAYGELLGWLDAGLGKAAEPVVRDLEAWLHPIYRAKTDKPAFSTFNTDYPMQAKLAEEAGLALQGYAEMTATADQFEKMAADFEEEYDNLLYGETKAANHDWTDEFIPEGALGKQAVAGVVNVFDLLPEAPPEKKSPATGGGDGLSKVVLDTVNKGVSGAVTPAVSDALTPSGPGQQHEKLQEKLRNLQRQQILEDLLTNDEVLAGAEPQNVLNAYEAILQTAPHVSLNKEVVRSILRQASQSMSVSPFDAKSWADLENQILKQTQAPTRGDV